MTTNDSDNSAKPHAVTAFNKHPSTPPIVIITLLRETSYMPQRVVVPILLPPGEAGATSRTAQPFRLVPPHVHEGWARSGFSSRRRRLEQRTYHEGKEMAHAPMPFRMTLLDMGKELVNADRSKDRIKALKDVMHTHWLASDKIYALHCDISAGNMSLTESGEGVLRDWDLPREMPSGDVTQRRCRTGTWQFLAVMDLQKPDHTRDSVDDLESFFWVLLYVSLTQTASNLSPSALAIELWKYDEAFDNINGIHIGGKSKEVSLGAAFRSLNFQDRPMLDTLIRKLSKMFNLRYELPDPALFREYERQIAKNPTAIWTETSMNFADEEECTAFRYFVNARKQMASAHYFISLLDVALDSKMWPASDRPKIHNLMVPMTNPSQSLQERESCSNVGLNWRVVRVGLDSRNWTSPNAHESHMSKALESGTRATVNSGDLTPPVACSCVACQHVTDRPELMGLGLGSFNSLVENYAV